SKLLGLGGWLPSVYNFYDANSKKLFQGDGQVRAVVALPWNISGFMIPSEDGSLVNFFDQTGRQLFTKTSITGSTRYAFNYDSVGRIESIDEPFGKTTYFNRDSSGNFKSVIAPNGETTAVALDANGYVSAFTNPNGEAYSMTYSGSFGLLATFTKPGGQTSTFTFDSDGNLARDSHSGGYFFDIVKNAASGSAFNFRKTTGLGRQTIYAGSSTPTSINRMTTSPGGQSTIFAYSINTTGGNDSQSTQSGGDITSSQFQNDPRFGASFKYLKYHNVQYGSASYLITNNVTASLSTPTDPFSIIAMTATTNKGAKTLSTSYSPTTKKFSSITGLGRSAKIGIDSYERVTSVKNGALDSTQLIYTNADLTRIQQGSRVTDLVYHSTSGLLESVTNPLSQITSFAYNNAGRMIAKTLPDLRVINFSYDGNGNIVGITPPGRTIHAFTSNSQELLGSYAPPAISGVSIVATLYSYNSDKQLTQITKPNGNSILFTYNTVTGTLQSMTTPLGSYAVGMNTSNSMLSSVFVPSGPKNYFTYSGTKLTENRVTTTANAAIY
ncbi:MAG: RHS repeat protein, partial [Proteobacteria bacterium]